ncbi:MAG: mechanosensitive ion channel family protein [Bacteroidia bacterium]|nr:mechanosensitive ion channel family protein [Bacteroidia bacterium]
MKLMTRITVIALLLGLNFCAISNAQSAAPLGEAGDSVIKDSLLRNEFEVLESQAEPTEEEDREDLRFSLKSPFHAVYTHLHYLQPESYFPDSAAMALWGKPGPEKNQLAIELKEFLDGSGHYINLDEVPNSPAYVDSATSKWRYVLVEDVPDIYLLRKNGKWYYSEHTLRQIPALHKSVYPFGTLNWIPSWGNKSLLGMKIWKWLGIMVFLFGTWLAFQLLTLILSNVIEGLVHRLLKKDIALNVIRQLGKPLSLFALTLTLQFFVPVLQLPILLNKWVVLTLSLLEPLFIVIASYKLVDVMSAYFAEKAKETETVSDDQLVPLLRKVGKGLVIVAGVVFILQSLKVDITALVAGISIGGLAIALAAQDTVKNFIGSILIFLDKPFQIGDLIVADGVEGTVEEVGIRATRIRTMANSLVYVPNGTLADTNVNNMGLRIYRRFLTKIGLTYDTPPEKIEAFVYGLREMILRHPDTRKEAFEVWFNEMDSSSLNILLSLFFSVPNWTAELKARQEILLGVMHLAQALEVSFAFPTQTLHIENFPEKASLTPVHQGDLTDQKAKVDEFLLKWGWGQGAMNKEQ